MHTTCTSLSRSHLNTIPQSLSVHQEAWHETSDGHILLTSHFLSLEIGWDFHQILYLFTYLIKHSCIGNFVISGMQSRQQNKKLQHNPECIHGCWCFRWCSPRVHYYNGEFTLQSAGVQAYAKKFNFYWIPKFRFGELWPVIHIAQINVWPTDRGSKCQFLVQTKHTFFYFA